MQQGQSVVVVGCGGVGLSAVMGAVLVGADPVIAVAVEPPLYNRKLGAPAEVPNRCDELILGNRSIEYETRC